MSRTKRAALLEAVAGQAVDAAEEGDVLVDGQRLVQREALRHVADAPLDAFRVAADVDAADQRGARRRASAARTACGWSSTCRRRWRRGSRRSSPRPTWNDRSSTATNSPKRRVRCCTSMAGPAGVASCSWSVLASGPARARGAPRPAARWPAPACDPAPPRAAPCASRTSVVVATPAAKRSPTTRRASAARAHAVGGGRHRGPAGGEIEQPLPDVGARRVSSSASRSRRGGDGGGGLGALGRGAAAVPQQPVDVDADVPRVLPRRTAREEARVRARVIEAAAKRDGRPARRRRRVDTLLGAANPQRQRLPLRAMLRAPPATSSAPLGTSAAAASSRRSGRSAAFRAAGR